MKFLSLIGLITYGLLVCSAIVDVNLTFQTGFLAGLDLSQCNSTQLNQLNSIPNATACFNQSLFFSPLSTICSKQCLPPIIRASTLVTEACQIASPGDGSSLKNSQSNLVYSVWANQSQANVACAPNTHRTGYCLGDLAMAATQLAFSTKHPSAICTPCNLQMYTTFRNNTKAIPSVYYYTIPSPSSVMNFLATACDW
ncbi:hypothetical protein DSO57_1037668 [Entomophthora muscae]|uniref:Uncharacterized protein n=1 Tax=Entomophthora muscae TaxID=34485 RepID=A0ACC2UIX3_9FUNG|nr:hypothetical protein DSO57_1037668 [Entomophthora muscae]